MVPEDPTDSAPVGDEPTPASSGEPTEGPDQPGAGDVTGTEPPAGVEHDEADVTHEEPTDPNAVGDFTDPPEGLPVLDVAEDEDGGDTDE